MSPTSPDTVRRLGELEVNAARIDERVDAICERVEVVEEKQEKFVGDLAGVRREEAVSSARIAIYAGLGAFAATSVIGIIITVFILPAMTRVH